MNGFLFRKYLGAQVHRTFLFTGAESRGLTLQAARISGPHIIRVVGRSMWPQGVRSLDGYFIYKQSVFKSERKNQNLMFRRKYLTNNWERSSITIHLLIFKSDNSHPRGIEKLGGLNFVLFVRLRRYKTVPQFVSKAQLSLEREQDELGQTKTACNSAGCHGLSSRSWRLKMMVFNCEGWHPIFDDCRSSLRSFLYFK